jgi:hypothetical protein
MEDDRIIPAIREAIELVDRIIKYENECIVEIPDDGDSNSKL